MNKIKNIKNKLILLLIKRYKLITLFLFVIMIIFLHYIAHLNNEKINVGHWIGIIGLTTVFAFFGNTLYKNFYDAGEKRLLRVGFVTDILRDTNGPKTFKFQKNYLSDTVKFYLLENIPDKNLSNNSCFSINISNMKEMTGIINFKTFTINMLNGIEHIIPIEYIDHVEKTIHLTFITYRIQYSFIVFNNLNIYININANNVRLIKKLDRKIKKYNKNVVYDEKDNSIIKEKFQPIFSDVMEKYYDNEFILNAHSVKISKRFKEKEKNIIVNNMEIINKKIPLKGSFKINAYLFHSFDIEKDILNISNINKDNDITLYQMADDLTLFNLSKDENYKDLDMYLKDIIGEFISLQILKDKKSPLLERLEKRYDSQELLSKHHNLNDFIHYYEDELKNATKNNGEFYLRLIYTLATKIKSKNFANVMSNVFEYKKQGMDKILSVIIKW